MTNGAVALLRASTATKGKAALLDSGEDLATCTQRSSGGKCGGG
jgi:hypothetical protein